MNSSRPYLIRAIYDWICDNDLTPYLVINAEHPDAQVPEEFIEDGRIVLNISPNACRGLHIENDRIVFSARFSGVAQQIFAPPSAALAIYAKENGRGMVFSADEDEDEGSGGIEPPPSAPEEGKRGKPKLKVVK